MSTDPDWIAAYLEHEYDLLDRRLYEAISSGLYPTAWGRGWSAKDWETGQSCLRRWTNAAVRNALHVINPW